MMVPLSPIAQPPPVQGGKLPCLNEDFEEEEDETISLTTGDGTGSKSNESRV